MTLKQLIYSRTLIWILIVAMSTQVAYANPKYSLLSKDRSDVNPLSEYIFGREMQETLMPVYVLGAVTKPGLYHVPVKTDLTTLLSIAGGPTRESDVEDIVVKRQTPEEILHFDYENIVSKKDLKSPIIESRDTIWIGTKEPVVSNNTMLIVALLVGVGSIITSAIIISNETK